MDALDILKLDNIVIRKIERVTVSRWRSTEKMHERHKAAGGEYVTDEKGREYMVDRKTNAMGGKYLLRFESGTGSQVHFNIKTDGVGDTIEAAYTDYLKKSGKA